LSLVPGVADAHATHGSVLIAGVAGLASFGNAATEAKQLPKLLDE
jgi:hypothetical protein